MSWDPEQYGRFAAQRAQPFHDLLTLVEPVPGGRAVDLGCGTGELTAALHRHLGAAETTGFDNARPMLDRAGGQEAPGLSFEHADVASLAPDGTYDVVLSNACLQWVPDHVGVIRRWSEALGRRGQLAVQVPANADHASHVVAAEVASGSPFRERFGGDPPPDVVRAVLPPERYAELLHELGFEHQHVRLQVYGHVLASTSEVVEWVRGTSLTRFRAGLGPELFEEFVAAYSDRLLAVLGDRRPYFYAFKRILFHARRP